MNSLKRISIEGFILLTIGVVLVTRACILKFPDTTIENRIFIIGCSFLGPGLGSTYKNIKFIRNPYNYEKYIKKRDFEKDVYIKDRVDSITLLILSYTAFVVLFVSVMLGKNEIVYLSCVLSIFLLFTREIIKYFVKRQIRKGAFNRINNY